MGNTFRGKSREAWRETGFKSSKPEPKPFVAVSYECKKGKHNLGCSKLDCPCFCH